MVGRYHMLYILWNVVPPEGDASTTIILLLSYRTVWYVNLLFHAHLMLVSGRLFKKNSTAVLC